MLREIEVVPYHGDYDPFGLMYLEFQYADKLLELHRVGVTTDPVPIMTIDDKAYRISEEDAEAYIELWSGNIVITYPKYE